MLICWNRFSSPCHSIFTSALRFTPVLKHCPPTPCLARLFSWCKVNYVSVSFSFCGCCLTRATKVNTRSGCPLYNLASNSKDFPESLAKLLRIIFLYFGTPLTCCRYLFSLFCSFSFLQMMVSIKMLNPSYCINSILFAVFKIAFGRSLSGHLLNTFHLFAAYTNFQYTSHDMCNQQCCSTVV